MTKIFGMSCENGYICNVFFIVLDLRLTKEGAAAPIFFAFNGKHSLFFDSFFEKRYLFFVKMDSTTYHATMMAMPAMPKMASSGTHESRKI